MMRQHLLRSAPLGWPPTGRRHFRSSSGARDSGLIEPIRKTRVAEEVADRIRVLILDGTFPAGQALPAERALAKQFDVSRGSIRDAFRTLETIGLLVTRHGQGTFPQELDVNRLIAPLASVLSYRYELQDELLDGSQRRDEPVDVQLLRKRAL